MYRREKNLTSQANAHSILGSEFTKCRMPRELWGFSIKGKGEKIHTVFFLLFLQGSLWKAW